MNLSSDILKQRLSTLNEKDHEEDDFLRIWRDRKIYFSEQPLPDGICGYYEVDEEGREHIILNSKIRGMERLLTMAHETSHSFLDQPIDSEVVKLFRTMKVIQDRQDYIAETLGLVLVFSLVTLKRYIATGELPEYLMPYLAERLVIFELYKI